MTTNGDLIKQYLEEELANPNLTPAAAAIIRLVLVNPIKAIPAFMGIAGHLMYKFPEINVAVQVCMMKWETEDSEIETRGTNENTKSNDD